MAAVYVGRAQGVAGFERLVALKVLHSNFAHEQEFMRMFLDEARLAARIRHPNVVPTIDISDSPERGLFLVMEYIEGDHLGALLSGAHKMGQRLPLDVALRVITDVLAGLGAAHDLCDEAGRPLHIVHRDVSPHNVMVGRDGISRLTDFGVAKAEDRLTHTRDGQVKGKLSYMAPEQASSGASDARSDLFSVGIILWESVTGRRLFRAENTGATLNRLLHGEIARPSSIDPALEPLDGVVMRALDRDPNRRFASADEFGEALEAAAQAVGGVGSLRSVSRAVKLFASAKLGRDKALIEEAKRWLRDQRGEEGFDLDAVSEPSMPSSSELSLSALSMSKVSGVYSSATSAGFIPPQSVPPLRVPPPVGSTPSGGLAVPDRSSASVFPDERGGARTGLRLALAIVVIAGAVFAWLASGQRDTVVVEPLSPRAEPAPAAPAPAPSAARAASAHSAQAVRPADPIPAPAAEAEAVEAIEVAEPTVAVPDQEPTPKSESQAADKAADKATDAPAVIPGDEAAQEAAKLEIAATNERVARSRATRVRRHSSARSRSSTRQPKSAAAEVGEGPKVGAPVGKGGAKTPSSPDSKTLRLEMPPNPYKD